MQSFSAIVSRPVSPAPDSAVFEADITTDWLQGKAAFGGIQGAIAMVAMRAAAGYELPLRAIQMTFIAALDEGPATARASVVRRGRAITHVQCELRSGDRMAALLVGLFGASRESQAQLDLPMPTDVRPYADLRDGPFIERRMPDFLRHYRQRWAGGPMPYSGTPARPARQWAMLREAAPDDGSAAPAGLGTAIAREANLIALADLTASPVISMLTRPAPSASLTWLLEFLRDPREFDPAQWLLVHTESRHAADGYQSQTAHMWDQQARAVAVSHQTTAIFG